jgi:hypothetical protein
MTVIALKKLDNSFVDIVANPAHPAVIFCPVLVCPQKAIVRINFQRRILKICSNLLLLE